MYSREKKTQLTAYPVTAGLRTSTFTQQGHATAALYDDAMVCVYVASIVDPIEVLYQVGHGTDSGASSGAPSFWTTIATSGPITSAGATVFSVPRPIGFYSRIVVNHTGSGNTGYQVDVCFSKDG